MYSENSYLTRKFVVSPKTISEDNEPYLVALPISRASDGNTVDKDSIEQHTTNSKKYPET